jgi:hypothetical protein
MADEKQDPECTRCITFYRSVDLRLSEMFKGAIECSVILDRDRAYRTRWIRNGLALAQFDLGPIDGNHGLYRYKVTVPREVNARGFDQVHVEPLKGGPPFSFGGVECTTAAELP